MKTITLISMIIIIVYIMYYHSSPNSDVNNPEGSVLSPSSGYPLGGEMARSTFGAIGSGDRINENFIFINDKNNNKK